MTTESGKFNTSSERPATHEEFDAMCRAFIEGNIHGPQEAYFIDVAIGAVFAKSIANKINLDSYFDFLDKTDFIEKAYEKMNRQHAHRGIDVPVPQKQFDETVRHQFNRAHDRVYRYAETLFTGYTALSPAKTFYDLTPEQAMTLSEALNAAKTFFHSRDLKTVQDKLIEGNKQYKVELLDAGLYEENDPISLSHKEVAEVRATWIPQLKEAIKQALSMKFGGETLKSQGVSDDTIAAFADSVVKNQ